MRKLLAVVAIFSMAFGSTALMAAEVYAAQPGGAPGASNGGGNNGGGGTGGTGCSQGTSSSGGVGGGSGWNPGVGGGNGSGAGAGSPGGGGSNGGGVSNGGGSNGGGGTASGGGSTSGGGSVSGGGSTSGGSGTSGDGAPNMGGLGYGTTKAQAIAHDDMRACQSGNDVTVLGTVRFDGSFGWGSFGPMGHTARFMKCMEDKGYTFGTTPAYHKATSGTATAPPSIQTP